MKNEKQTLQKDPLGMSTQRKFFDAHQCNMDFHPLPTLPFQVYWTIIINLFSSTKKAMP